MLWVSEILQTIEKFNKQRYLHCVWTSTSEIYLFVLPDIQNQAIELADQLKKDSQLKFGSTPILQIQSVPDFLLNYTIPMATTSTLPSLWGTISCLHRSMSDNANAGLKTMSWKRQMAAPLQMTI